MELETKRPVVHIRPESGVGVLDPAEIWKFRVLLAQMISRNIRSRIVNSPISIVWGFIRPTIMTLSLIYIRHVSSADFGENVPYALFVFSGLCYWFLFAETTIQTAGSISADAGLSKKVYFPKLLSPLSIVLSRWPDLLIITAAVICAQLAMGVSLSLSLWAIIPVLATLLFLAFGIGVLFAGLMILHRDYSKFLETGIYLGLFLSPVLFSKSILPPTVQAYYAANPMVGILTGVRGALFAPEAVDWRALLFSFAIALAFSIVGLVILSRAARLHAERI